MRFALPPSLIAGALAVASLVLGVGCPHVCDSTTCPDGCCEGGICWIDNTDDSCGLRGAACQYCSFDEKCSQGRCVSCGSYADACTTSANCCASYSCTFDSFYNRNICK